jgi:hypothetical protein
MKGFFSEPAVAPIATDEATNKEKKVVFSHNLFPVKHSR